MTAGGDINRRMGEWSEIRNTLSNVYTARGVSLWLKSPQGRFDGRTARELIDEGEGHRVLEAAQQIAGGNFG